MTLMPSEDKFIFFKNGVVMSQPFLREFLYECQEMQKPQVKHRASSSFSIPDVFTAIAEIASVLD